MSLGYRSHDFCRWPIMASESSASSQRGRIRPGTGANAHARAGARILGWDVVARVLRERTEGKTFSDLKGNG